MKKEIFAIVGTLLLIESAQAYWISKQIEDLERTFDRHINLGYHSDAGHAIGVLQGRLDALEK